MDHHCPWINNCIGFWNRKFFILLLIYVLVVTYFVAFTMTYAWLDSISWMLDSYYYSTKQSEQKLLSDNLIIQFAYMLNGVVLVLVTMFLKFHLNLALQSKTTIENLEHKNKPFVSDFDIGPTRNWMAIFGQNVALWPFPMFLGSGKPLGDGIYWPKKRSEGEINYSNASPMSNNRLISNKKTTPKTAISPLNFGKVPQNNGNITPNGGHLAAMKPNILSPHKENKLSGKPKHPYAQME